ncbi:MAG TPA: DHH family phosphoesterase [Candidatus Pacearchaeota archaeon]|jgi:single-stranded-DNA-specific exonuclease|nr:DHH family phosphoesterase [Candidatus Pacearchaeota archaeon]HPC30518.1 DHH family phosphoesterase [Candidatus Pacearchaeota archaeon]
MAMKIKNIELAAERICQAVLRGEQIIIFADSDLDGVASATLMKETIDNLVSVLPEKNKKEYPDVLAFFPDRHNEGYGLNDKALIFIKTKKILNFKPALLITLDCGITNYAEIESAKQSGFDVIIIDHHIPIGGQLPKADIIVDPKQPEDNFPFKEYCNTGLTFKLSQEILGDKMSSLLKESFLQLTALATISDMMIEEDENKDFILQGLANIEKSQRPALRALVEILGPQNFNSTRDLVSKMNGILNSSLMDDHVMLVYKYLIESNFEKAKIMANQFIEEHETRQREIISLTENIKYQLGDSPLDLIIFIGSPQYNIEYLGSVASRLANYYNKPVFLYEQHDEYSRGTVRVPKGCDAVKAMESCSYLLQTFGGHPAAAGFTVANENLEKFKEELIKYFSKISWQ